MSRLINLRPPSFFSKKPGSQKPPVDENNSNSKFVRFSEKAESPISLDFKSSEVIQASQNLSEILYLQEIIKQQRTEIDRLTSEAQRKEEFWNESLKKVELHYKREIVKEMDLIREMEKKIDRTVKEHQMEKERISKVNADLLLSLSLSRKVLEDEEERFKAEDIRLNETISQQEEQLKVQCHELTRMRSYIDQSECSYKSKERVDHYEQLKDSHEKWKLIESEKNLLEEKLDITTEMMKIQEKEIDRAAGIPSEARKCLLEKWRFKVFQLMVQIKFNEMSFKDDEEKFIEEIRLANDAMLTLKNKLDVSEKSNRNKNSEIELLSEKLKISKSEEEILRNHIKKETNNMNTLCRSFNSSFEMHLKKLDESASVVLRLDNRLKFLSYRVDLVKGELAKRNKKILSLEAENVRLRSISVEHENIANIKESFKMSKLQSFVRPKKYQIVEKDTSLVEEIKFLSSVVLQDEIR